MDRAPFVGLQIDQEVFIDSVREGDTVADATVATEVTSFDRIGDAYVLEGAVLFTGNLQEEGPEIAEAPEESALQLSPLDARRASSRAIRSFHHRMPFVLRVPTDVQPRGIVNVASRIAGWNLEAVSAGWMRVVADLHVVGLNGDHGYHFLCGGQEDGDLFFGRETSSELVDSSVEESQPELVETASYAVLDTVDAEDDYELARGPKDQLGGRADGTQEHISQARGGHGPQDSLSAPAPHLVDEDGMRTELRRFDEALEGKPPVQPPDVPRDPYREAHQAQSAERTEGATGKGHRMDAGEEFRATPWAEFEFVDQVTSDDGLSAPPGVNGRESFSASRSFGADGFKATEGFVPEVRLSARDEPIGDPVQDESLTGAFSDVAEPGIYGSGIIDNRLWSFVDFHVPDTLYTLRFVVVGEEETLDTIADEVGCAKPELLRVNRLLSDAIYPGQTLRVPSAKQLQR